MTIVRYESYEILTGPLRGKRYSWQEAGALGDPIYKPGRASATNRSDGTISGGLKVFLCHSSADKDAVRRLHASLLQDGLRPWLDMVDLTPGVEWKLEIERSVRGADVVLVCLSRSSISKTGFVQVEMLANAWFPHSDFKLSCGSQDKIPQQFDALALLGRGVPKTVGNFAPRCSPVRT